MLNRILGAMTSSVFGDGEGENKAIQLIQALSQSQGGVQGLIEKCQQSGFFATRCKSSTW